MMQIDWANTPGGFYAIAYWLCLGIMIHTAPRRYEVKKSIGITMAFGIMLFAAMTVTHGLPQIFFVPLMILFVFLLWANMYFVSTYDPMTALYLQCVPLLWESSWHLQNG